MTREQALEIAKQTSAAHLKAVHDGMFGRGPEYTPAMEKAEFGYRHGWYQVGEFSFNHSDIDGQQYDYTQGGWAYL